MKGAIFERTKYIVLNIDEHAVGIASEVLDDERTIEIAWEALNLFELYIYYAYSRTKCFMVLSICF